MIEKMKILLLFSTLILLSACQIKSVRDGSANDEKKSAATTVPPALNPNPNATTDITKINPAEPTPSPVTTNNTAPMTPPATTPVPPAPETAPVKMKTGLSIVLGPGAIRSYAHIGFLQELTKARVPIASISGIEWGAVVAGIYAHRAQIYDVEWQFSKLKEDDWISRKMLSSEIKAQSVSSLNKFLKDAFVNDRVEDGKLNFACPALNMQKKEVYLMNKGPWTELLPYCVPSPPLFSAYNFNVAAMSAPDWMVRWLKQNGAQKIVYVDLISDFYPLVPEADNEAIQFAWSQAALSAKDLESQRSVEVIHIPLNGIYLTDYDKRREALQIGQESGRKFVNMLRAAN